ncbi:phospholipid/cholesterol/gamma-HCH transport system substrate-binding protein [Rhodococcus sp. OK519]|uniref:MCE family protein n=1 Tax=Rhodococcus sp. OK519 TaxID=2135729 RepID=UPI000D389669|nr:phospholipid/cholesterol/gamma-HCH transport system substrate-binding protein [Rhodococcus sp. OK519]
MAKGERNLTRIGIIGVAVSACLVLAGLQYDRLPFLFGNVSYEALFEDAGGLMPGDFVTVAGVNVGKVENIELDGTEVRVRFSMNEGIRLGDSTGADIKTNTVLGRKSMQVTSEGSDVMRVGSTIPLERTNSPYSLNDALGDLTSTVADLDTNQLNDSLNAVSETLSDTPPELRAALDGVTRLSQSINSRDESLKDLLGKAEDVTKILADRSDQINSLILDGNQLLGELDRRRNAISELITNVSAVSQQLTGLVQDNEQQMKPTLDKLNAVVANLQNNKDNIGQALEGLAPYARSLGEAVGSGPFFMAYVANFSVSPMVQTVVDQLLWPEHVPQDLSQFPPLKTELKDPNR